MDAQTRRGVVLRCRGRNCDCNAGTGLGHAAGL